MVGAPLIGVSGNTSASCSSLIPEPVNVIAMIASRIDVTMKNGRSGILIASSRIIR